MFEHLVHRERNRDFHLISMGKLDGYPVAMDFTSFMQSAEQSDEKRGYTRDNGHQWGVAEGIEIMRAREYAEYVLTYLTSENMNRFNTVQRSRDGTPLLNRKGEPVRGYSFFTDMSTAKEEPAQA